MANSLGKGETVHGLRLRWRLWLWIRSGSPAVVPVGDCHDLCPDRLLRLRMLIKPWSDMKSPGDGAFFCFLNHAHERGKVGTSAVAGAFGGGLAMSQTVTLLRDVLEEFGGGGSPAGESIKH